ncbi:OLC1v1025108C1 [Oldenlandia corymbosa var. corymbosa]|uniref:OLC1v1025108C1 n=1 Tax=Oldenlandia corymbosa var. corymbosa TaxID=529605 RepID=A0AAV1C4V0_OLDCO|nr:OLC1v1025108C1 [Oldenlandia corymbosa var. corymbosa]
MEFETRTRSVFDRLGGPKRPQFKSQVTPRVCSFWLAGKCNRNYCRFLHPGLPKVQPSSGDHRRNKFTYSLKNDAREFGVNDVATIQKQVLVAGKSSLVVGSKNVLMNAKVLSAETSGSVIEHRGGRIITLKKGSVIPKADDNGVNQKKVLTVERSGPVVQRTKVTTPSSNIVLDSDSEAKNSVEKVLTDERPGPVVQSKNAEVPSSNRATDSGIKSAAEKELTSEKPDLVVQSKNATVPAFNTTMKCEVRSDTTSPVVQSKNVPVSSSNNGTKYEVKSDPANQKMVMTTTESCSAAESCENTGLTLCQDWVVGNCLKECIETLKAHKESVTSLAFWDRYLFSGSLDSSLKVWGVAENGSLAVIFEMKQESGILALCGINNGTNRPVLLCSCKDNIVRVYDLPTFAGRGRTFSNGEVQTLEIGCGGLFFSGDSTGRGFVEFVARALLHRPTTIPLRNFQLTLYYSHNHRHRSFVSSFIPYALDCKFDDLDLNLIDTGDEEEEEHEDNDEASGSNPTLYHFHLCDLSNGSVKRLTLCRCELIMSCNDSFRFESLRVLDLASVEIADDSLSELIMRCRNLERLSLDGFREMKRKFRVISESLKHLQLRVYYGAGDEETESSIEIRTPNLSTIDIIHFHVANYTGDLSSVIEARLILDKDPYYSQDSWNSAMNLLIGVETLFVRNMWLPFLYPKFQSGEYLVLRRLKHLEMKTRYTNNDMMGISLMLEVSPVLETLGDYLVKFEDGMYGFKIPSLQEVKLKRFRATNAEMFILVLLHFHKVALKKVLLAPVIDEETYQSGPVVLDPAVTGSRFSLH